MSRTRFYVIGFALLAVTETFTQVALKLATEHTGEFGFAFSWLKAAALSPWIYAALAGYVVAFVTWMTVLEHAPVGPAHAASHIDVVTVLVVSVPLFAEHISVRQIIGAACIIGGILLLSIHRPESSSL